MATQSYTMRRFETPSSLVGKGNYLANKLTQFFSLNPTISVVTVSCNWHEGRSRADTLYFNLLYRGGGSQGRMWASQFNANATQTCEDVAQLFFNANPSYVPVQTALLSRPDTQPRNRKLLVIYATGSNVQVPCLLNAPVGVPAADVAEGAYGVFYDNLNPARSGLPALNLGNATWPNGAANMLVRALGSDPNLCAWGGIAPCCFTGDPFVPPVAPTPDLYCVQCIDPDDVTITYTTITTSSTSTSSSTSSSSSTTTSTTTSSSSSTTTSTTTTSTTTTTADPCASCPCGAIQPDINYSCPAGQCAQDTNFTFLSLSCDADFCRWKWGGTLGSPKIVIFFNRNTLTWGISNNVCGTINPLTFTHSCIAGVITGTATFSSGDAQTVTITFG